MAGIAARETPTVVSDDKMIFDNELDVPSPVDLRSMKDARTWAEEVSDKRPWREDFFNLFIDELQPYAGPELAILELGSGSGFMAEKIINNISFSRYTALDFSDAMHTLAKERLGSLSNKINFITRDFLHSD